MLGAVPSVPAYIYSRLHKVGTCMKDEFSWVSCFLCFGIGALSYANFVAFVLMKRQYSSNPQLLFKIPQVLAGGWGAGGGGAADRT